jgi:predicted CopG family antitoxin
MKAVTIHVEEPVYKDFQTYAQKHKRSTSDVIREAMELYQYKIQHENRHSILDSEPSRSVGEFLKPLRSREEMLEGYWDRT